MGGLTGFWRRCAVVVWGFAVGFEMVKGIVRRRNEEKKAREAEDGETLQCCYDLTTVAIAFTTSTAAGLPPSSKDE